MKYEHIIQSVKAQTTPTPFTPITSMSPENLNCGGPVTISCALGYIVSILINLAGAIAVIYLIYSGILFITAASNPDQAKRGQQGVVNAIIGIIIVMTARIIVAAVVNTFSR